MMSSVTTQRAGRAPKDKSKPQTSHSVKTPSDVTKTSEGIVSKIQPTAEQLRIAQIVNSANKAEYPELKDKVERIIEITGGSSDAALVALHDCDNDSNRAAIMLLEGNQDEGKWETSGKKKKSRQVQPKAPEVNGHEPAPVEKEEKEPVENTSRRREPKQRGGGGGYGRYGPPRMNRGANQGRNWRNKENEKNERNLQEGRKERNNEGRFRGPRRGRGRGGRSRTFQNRGLHNDGFPESIDTWTNSTAEKVNNNTADGTMTVGNWSDIAVAEEWSEEDWAENLTETKVFTPSAGTQSTAVTNLDIPTATVLGPNIDLASFLQKASSNPDQVSNSLGASSVPQQTSLMSQQMVQQTVAPPAQPHFDFNQFAKQAAETIKAAVGVVSVQNSSSTPSINANSYQSSNSTYQSSYNVNSSNSQHRVQIPHELQQVIVSQSGFSSGSSAGVHLSRDLHSPVVSQQSPTVAKTTTSQHQAPLPQRAKPPKARLPPPSKIPESAVVMPDDAVTSLDLQFGALQFGTDSSPFDFTSVESNSYQDLGQSSGQAMSASIASQSSFSSVLPSSMSKEPSYSMGSHGSPNQNDLAQKVANQENMLLSQNEHKSVESVSSYVSHRTNQAATLEGPMMSSKADQQSAMNSYNSSSHDSAYSSNPYSSQKSVLSSSNLVPSTVSYSHTSSSLNSVTSDLTSSQPPQPKYQSQVVTQQSQSSSSYGSGSASYGLQQTPYSGSVTTSGSTYPSQTGYSSHSSGTYGSNSSAYSTQQGVYSGSVATTTQSGAMMSTSISNSKLTNSLTHGVKDSSLLESQHSSSQHVYEVASTTSSSSVLTANSLASTSSTNHSAQQSSSNMNSVLGLVSTSSSTTTTSVLKNSLSASKAVPNIPQNMPAMLGHQYIMGQSLPFYGLQQPVYSYEDMQMLQSKLSTLGLQSPVYSYEDVQMLQSKLSTLGYYDMQFQAPTSMTGRDPGMGNVAYTADGKYSRADTDASTVSTTLSQGQASTQAHGQAFLNPAAALPPGYGYYFAGGMMTGGIHHYAPPLFPVPPATNTHGATSNSQFQKANAYGSHSYNSGYEGLSQAQDYSKGTYGAASQSQVKGVSGSGAVPDLSGSVYSKAHAQLAKSYDKPGFHTGTPPPFNLAGSQAAGPLGASSATYPQFIPVMAHNQHHNTILHHHMQQDTSQTGGTPAAGQRGPQGLGQQKSSNKQNYAYWTNN